MIYIEEILLQFFIIISPIVFYQMYLNDERLFSFRWKPHKTLFILMVCSVILVVKFPIIVYFDYVLDFHSLIIMYVFLYGNRKVGLFLSIFTAGFLLFDSFEWGVHELILFPFIYFMPYFLHPIWKKKSKKLKYILAFVMSATSIFLHFIIIFMTNFVVPADITTVTWYFLFYFSFSYVVVFFVMIFITEFIIETIQLRRAVEESEKMMVVSELAASIAHEVRNPLTVVKGFVQLVERDANETNKDYLNLVLSELDRAESIITDYLQLAKKNQMQKEVIQMCEVLQAVYTVMSSYTNMKGIVLQLHIGEELYFQGDRSKITQACFNLVKNAAEAIQHSNGHILLSCYAEDGYAVIEVKDNGVGMEQTEIARIGEAFYTNKESGTGLGVMVTKSIVQEHNGIIVYESEKGQGTKVKIKLPICEK